MSLLGSPITTHPDVIAARAERAKSSGLLSQSDVDALPDETIVEVIWGGGNGPHRYELYHRDGRSYALIPGDARDREEFDHGILGDRALERVGGPDALMDDWVRLPTDAPWPERHPPGKPSYVPVSALRVPR